MTEIEIEYQHDAIVGIKAKVKEYFFCLPYFRGQANYDWKIESSLFRDDKNLSVEKLLEKEKENVAKMKNDYPDMIFDHPNECLKEWFWLTQAQHLGYKTRLIDWTPDLTAALWMGMDYDEKDEPHNMDKDGALFMVQTNLQSIFDEIDLIKRDSDMFNFLSIPVNWNKDFNKQEGQKRVLRQIGKFFIPANKDINKSIDDTCDVSYYIIKLKIPKEMKQSLHEHFQNCNMNFDKMYFPKYDL